LEVRVVVILEVRVEVKLEVRVGNGQANFEVTTLGFNHMGNGGTKLWVNIS